MCWAHLHTGWIKNTKANFRTAGKSKDWWIDTVIVKVRKMLETAGGRDFS
jgi:hypothetical protein